LFSYFLQVALKTVDLVLIERRSRADVVPCVANERAMRLATTKRVWFNPLNIGVKLSR
jgi:hypothetical protein